MNILKLASLALAGMFAILSAERVHAADKREVTPVVDVTFTLRPDRAYVLFRVDESKSRIPHAEPVFLRKPASAAPTDSSLAQETTPNDKIPNVFSVKTRFGVKLDKRLSAYLIEVDPADYVVYGATYGEVLDTCDCLGSVGFAAKSGVITDLGTFLFDGVETKSGVPGMAATSGIGPYNGHLIIGTALRTVSTNDAVPPAASGRVKVAAEFYPVPAFVEPGTDNIFRLAPVAGVLDYRDGRAVDVKTGKTLP